MTVHIIVEQKPRSLIHEWSGSDSIYWTAFGREQKVDCFYTTEQSAQEICKRLNRVEPSRKFITVCLSAWDNSP